MKLSMRTVEQFPRLINGTHPLPASESPFDLVAAPFSNGEQQLRAEAAEQLLQLISQIGGQKQIIVTSGYRSYTEQKRLYEHSLRLHGKVYTEKYVAKPGCSEHQLGLAVDLGFADSTHDEICPSFEGKEISQQFLSHMSSYGFILRYPKGKEAITGIAYEPWHFRYVGCPHSEIITQEGWTLEEYYIFGGSGGEANDCTS